MLLFGATGTLLVFRWDLDARLRSELYRVQPTKSEKLSIDSLVETALVAHPGYTLGQWSWPDIENPPFQVKLKPESEKLPARHVYLDPYTGHINGTTSPDAGLMYWLANLHANLLAGKTGRLVVGSLGLAILGMLTTGMLLYTRFHRGRSFGKLRMERGARHWLSDLHLWVGVITLATNFFWATTGVVLGLSTAGFDLTGKKPHEHIRTVDQNIRIGHGDFSYAGADKAARAAFQGRRIVQWRAPSKGSIAEAQLSSLSPITKEGATRILIDMGNRAGEEKSQGQARILSIADAEKTGMAGRTFFAIEPLHYGRLGSDILRWAYAIFAGFSCLLYLSGFAIFALRKGWRIPSQSR